jgi:hypothetical protein
VLAAVDLVFSRKLFAVRDLLLPAARAYLSQGYEVDVLADPIKRRLILLACLSFADPANVADAKVIVVARRYINGEQIVDRSYVDKFIPLVEEMKRKCNAAAKA